MEWAKSEDNSLTHVSFSSPGGAIDRRYWRHRGEVYRLRLHLLLLRFGRDANYWTSVSVCLSVCLIDYLKNVVRILPKFPYMLPMAVD